MSKTAWCRFLLIAILLIFGIQCKKEDDIYSIGNKDAVNLNEIIAFTSVSPVSLIADSVSVCAISVQINVEAGTDSRQVKFYTDGGTFANGDTVQRVTVNSQGAASAFLISKVPKKTNVRVSVKDTYIIDTVINFLPSLPDDMLLTADAYTGDTSTGFRFTSVLFRNPGRGIVSDPAKVMFYVTPLDTNVNMVYPQFAFSDNRTATIDLINPYHVIGRFNVVARAAAASGDSISRSVIIVVKK